jgi:Tol biopolymer transport system component
VLYQSSGSRRPASPAVSPDGSKLAFAERESGEEGKGDIFVLDLTSGSATKLLTLPRGRLADLVWMPDGESLLVGTEGASGAQLWRVSAAGDSLQRALMAPRRQPVVSVHPDGRRVALTIGETHEEIWVLEHATRPTTEN